MIVRCEICGKRVSRKKFNSNLTDNGKAKNKGECDSCADEHREKMLELLSNTVVVTDDAVHIGFTKYPVSEG